MDNWKIISIMIAIGGSAIGSLIYHILTLNMVFAGLSIWMLSILALAIYMIRRYYVACRLLGIERASVKTKEDWDKHFFNSKKIRVFFTRGGAVLGTDTDPMYQTVKGLPADWDGEIKVLILNPKSTHIVDRARELDLEPDAVREQCRRVMKNIDRLSEKHHINILGKYYDSKPFLRFTLFDNFGFFSYPAWGKKYRPYSYHFKMKPRAKSLYESLSTYFDQLWEIAEPGDNHE